MFFKDGDNIVTNKELIANKFNSFFTNIGTTLSQQIKSPKNKSFKSYLTKNYNNTFTFQSTSEETIGQIINKLAPKTSFGFDGISTKLLKTIKDAIIKLLTVIINKMLNTGIFSEKLNIAKIIPVYKKEDDTLFTNYRPKSLLPTVSKIFENVIFKQLYHFVLDKKLLYNAQYGFRTDNSTEYASLQLVDRIIVEMHKMNAPVNIFLDFSKAFDTLNHKILLDKFEHYGINEISLWLIESYLTNRKQYVEIDGSNSDMLSLTTGVPQGSILGALLFIIYINDIAQASKLFDFIIYADDTTLSTTLEIVIRNTPNLNADNILILN